MAHLPTEDITGDIDPFAVEEEDNVDDLRETTEELTVETVLVRDLRKYCKEQILVHNSFDVLNLPQNATPEEKCAVFDEMFNHKGVVHHLRQIQQIINSKVKEN